MSYRKLMIAPPLAQISVLANNGLHLTRVLASILWALSANNGGARCRLD